MNRRRLLQAIGTAAVTTSLAGCGGVLSSDEEEGGDETTTASSGTTASDGTSTDDSTTSSPQQTTTGAPGRALRVGATGCQGTLLEKCDEVQTVSGGNISEDTVLGGDCSRYLVESNVEVSNGATLTVEPGTTVEFAQDAGLKVANGSVLSAVGTCEHPILFTGEQETRGYWRGIYFSNSDQAASRLENCVVEYGGSEDYYYADVAANLAVAQESRVTVKNCTFRESAGYGVTFREDVTVTEFSDCLVTANEGGAAFVRDRSAHSLSNTGTYTGNDEDHVYVRADNHVSSGMEVQWDAIDVPYRVKGLVDVKGDGHLTIQGGSTLEFEQSGGLKVYESAKLTAVGIDPDTEQSKPITFTGVQKTRGYWKGIYFVEADQVLSRLSNCVIEYGGKDDYYYADEPANLAIASGARVAVQGCTIRESDGYGFTIREDATVDAFVNNTVTANTDGAGYVRDRAAHYVDASGTYTGNDDDQVTVLSTNDITDEMDVTWDAIDARYVIVDGVAEVYGGLTVEPGATISFGQGSGLGVYNGGYLTAVGMDPDTEETRPITFTGEQKTRGYWRGIYFKNTDRTENQLRYCVVEYGGKNDFYYADEPANVAVTQESRVRIDNSTIRESGGYGFTFREGSSVDSFTMNNVTRNAEGAGYVRSASAHLLDGTSTYVGNDDDRVYVYARNNVDSDMDVTWDAIDARYFVDDGMVEVYGGLTVEPGATISFGQNSSIAAKNGGFLRAVGTSDEPITFTGEQKTAGYWRGLYYTNTINSNNRLHYCVVEYGGKNDFYYAPVKANVAVTNGSSLSLQNSTLRNSAGYGYTVTNDSSVTASANDLTGNALGTEFIEN